MSKGRGFDLDYGYLRIRHVGLAPEHLRCQELRITLAYSIIERAWGGRPGFLFSHVDVGHSL